MNSCCALLFMTCAVLTSDAWSTPFYPVQRAPMRFTRFAPHPHSHSQRTAAESPAETEVLKQQRPKRDYEDYDGYHHGDRHRGTAGVTGPVHTFVKTDKNANYKWGVRHHVGNKYAS